ncbi:uncharacterized protein LOC125674854, partial [Ostrea edulis]|uniref:uncharacterized protein LOC125674854 n=1 Tax=Ostrea edulis TaxID=37623 RepID=UPI0024AF41AD
FPLSLSDIIAGAGGGFAVIVIILIIVICVRMRKKTPGNKSVKGELDTDHKNDAYDHEADLPYNPLYHSNKSADEVGYSTVEEQHHNAVLPLQTNTDHSHNAKSPETNNQNKDYTPDIPMYAIPIKPKNTPTETTGGAVYVVPNKPNNTLTETAGGAVYAQKNKPKKNTAQAPLRTHNQEGLVYMQVEHSDAPITQNAPHLIINASTAENVMYAEIQK